MIESLSDGISIKRLFLRVKVKAITSYTSTGDALTFLSLHARGKVIKGIDNKDT